MTVKPRRIPVGEGLFVDPSSPATPPRLIAGHCRSCGEVMFPRQALCGNCCQETVEEMLVGPKGRLYSYTSVHFAGPEVYGYKGPVPYGVGEIELPEGVLVTSPLTEHDITKLKPGMEMELVIEKIFTDDEGNEVVGFKFKPVRA